MLSSKQDQGHICRLIELQTRQTGPSLDVPSHCCPSCVPLVSWLCLYFQDHRVMEDVPTDLAWSAPNKFSTGGHGIEIHHWSDLQWLYLGLWLRCIHKVWRKVMHSIKELDYKLWHLLTNMIINCVRATWKLWCKIFIMIRSTIDPSCIKWLYLR